VPFSVRVKAEPPATTKLGLRLVMAYPDELIVNVVAPEAAPPGFVAVTLALPAAAIRLAATDAVSWVALTNAVGSAEPFHRTVAPERKPVPFTVRVKAAAPELAEFGLRLVMAGTGVLTGKLKAFDDTPSGSITTTVAVPAAAIRLAGTGAVSCVALTNVVTRADPLNWMTAPETNPLPFTVSWKVGLVAVAEFGLRLVMVSAGALIVKLTTLDKVPPGTVTPALPGEAIRVAGTKAVSWVPLT
jgi:hypothetical protein